MTSKVPEHIPSGGRVFGMKLLAKTKNFTACNNAGKVSKTQFFDTDKKQNHESERVEQRNSIQFNRKNSQRESKQKPPMFGSRRSF